MGRDAHVVRRDGRGVVGAREDSASPSQWIADALVSPLVGVVTSWVPTGFEAYARVLHEVEGYDGVSEVLRWRDVARWNGVPLGPDTDWTDLALPEVSPSQAPPWQGQGPREGWLSRIDTLALSDVLDPTSRTPCFFGVWRGWGDLIDVVGTGADTTSRPARYEPQPDFELPWREYQLYTGTSRAAASFVAHHGRFVSPSLWWAADRSWFVATEVDLQFTFVAACGATIDRLLADPRLESTRSGPDVSLERRVAPWLAAKIDTACEQVLATGVTVIELSMGTVSATYEKRGWGHGWLSTTSRANFGGRTGGGTGRVTTGDHEQLRSSVRVYLEAAVHSLVR